MSSPQKNNSSEKNFYDIHCHIFNLSHPGLLIFINRFFLNNALNFSDLFNFKFWKLIIQIVVSKKIPQYVVMIAIAIILFIFIVIIGMRLEMLRWIMLKFYLISNDSANLVSGGKASQFWVFVSEFVIILFYILLIGWVVWRANKIAKGIKNFIWEKSSKIINLLALMEQDIGTQFLCIERDILGLNKKAEESNQKEKTFTIDEKKYNKVILTPLMMDFGNKGFKKFEKGIRRKIHYIKYFKTFSSKPITEQVLDLFNGIRQYNKNSNYNILEIYPFMGINTKNYKLGIVKTVSEDTIKKLKDLLESKEDWKLKGKITYIKKTNKLIVYNKIEDNEENRKAFNKLQIDKKTIDNIIKTSQTDKSCPKNNIPKMLNKYFGEREKEYALFKEKYKMYLKDEEDEKDEEIKKEKKEIYDIDSIGNNFFIGIKLYPPLGFDPLPKDSDELDKVHYLYQFCEDNEIPITIHCSKGGFETCKSATEYSNPSKWEKILAEYPNLKINFGHFGIEQSSQKDKEEDIIKYEKTDWTKTILDLMKEKKYNNVYADFSCKGMNEDFYKDLETWINDLPENEKEKVESRILFGTDLPVNLFDIESYYKYLSHFSNTSALKEQKHKFCSINPNNFLFKCF